MAMAFQQMLERFGLTEKMHALNADNMTANDTQTTKLDTLKQKTVFNVSTTHYNSLPSHSLHLSIQPSPRQRHKMMRRQRKMMS